MAAARKRVILVTGANKGIGYCAVEQLLALGAGHVVVGSRDLARGRAALERLGTPADAEVLQLDVTDDASVRRAAERVRERHGAVDVLVNNAGWLAKGDAFGPDLAETTHDVNVHGVARVTDAFLPLVADGGRVIITGSRMGQTAIGRCSDAVRARLLADDVSVADVRAMSREYVDAVRAGTDEAAGWPRTMYGVSKAMAASMCRAYARDAGARVWFAIASPGWCRTDMTSEDATRSAAEGADVLSWLATGAEYRGPSGRFWADRKQEPFA